MATATPAAPTVTPHPTRLTALVVLWAGLGASIVALVVSLNTFGRPGSYLTTPFGEFAGFVLSVSLLATGYLLLAALEARLGDRLDTAVRRAVDQAMAVRTSETES